MVPVLPDLKPYCSTAKVLARTGAWISRRYLRLDESKDGFTYDNGNNQYRLTDKLGRERRRQGGLARAKSARATSAREHAITPRKLTPESIKAYDLLGKCKAPA